MAIPEARLEVGHDQARQHEHARPARHHQRDSVRGRISQAVGLIEPGRAATFVLLDRPLHSAGKTLLDSIQLGDLPGIGMMIVDGAISTHRSRNTPPATAVPEVVKP